MIEILNFSHPLSAAALEQVQALTGTADVRVQDIRVQIDNGEPVAPQCSAIVDGIGRSTYEWQTIGTLVIPPAFAPALCCVLAEIHGRAGYFPAILRMRPIAGVGGPPQFEPAEIVHLNDVRESARRKR